MVEILKALFSSSAENNTIKAYNNAKLARKLVSDHNLEISKKASDFAKKNSEERDLEISRKVLAIVKKIHSKD